MKRLLKVRENAIDTYYIEDSDADKTYCCDWDLNEEEEKELVKEFLTYKGNASSFRNAEEAEEVNEDWFLSHDFTVLDYVPSNP